MNLDLSNFSFVSNNHTRFESDFEIEADNSGCKRGIKIESNIWGGEGFTVTIHNLDGDFSAWGRNIQMAPKQMKLIHKDELSMKFEGFGEDSRGYSFQDYGMTLHLSNDEVCAITMHMFDRDIDIYYYND